MIFYSFLWGSEGEEFKYADLLDDDVFKLVFGRESSKDVMIEFLNQVIDDRTIVDLDFMDKEMKSEDRKKKDSTYDMFCRTDDGSRIIVEVQRRKQPFYPERTLYYSTFQIQHQVESGAENYDFLPVYVINILNFNLDVNADNAEAFSLNLRSSTKQQRKSMAMFLKVYITA